MYSLLCLTQTVVQPIRYRKELAERFDCVRYRKELVERFDCPFEAVTHAVTYWPESEGDQSVCFVEDESGVAIATLVPVAGPTTSVRVVYADGTTAMVTDIAYHVEHGSIVGTRFCRDGRWDLVRHSTLTPA